MTWHLLQDETVTESDLETETRTGTETETGTETGTEGEVGITIEIDLSLVAHIAEKCMQKYTRILQAKFVALGGIPKILWFVVEGQVSAKEEEQEVEKNISTRLLFNVDKKPELDQYMDPSIIMVIGMMRFKHRDNIDWDFQD